MSNYHAIATVTAAISHILAGVKHDVPGTNITTKPPDVLGSQTAANTVNLFLYQVTHNIGYKDWDLPTRNTRGELVKKPLLPLNLDYLLTAYATDNDELQAHQILASAIRILHENSVLTRDMVRATIQAEAKIAGSDLADQVELVKITPRPLSLEEITKLWSSFFQTNYRISVAYQATVVLLESKEEPRPTLPVKDRLLYVLPFKQPVIERVEPQILERKPDAKLTIIGRNLKGEEVAVRFGKISVTPKTEDVIDDRIIISVPDVLTAGIKPVKVMHKLKVGSPPTPRDIYQSNLVAFVLAPRITHIDPVNVTRGSDLTLRFEPAITTE
jgi:hypothetical protein